MIYRSKLKFAYGEAIVIFQSNSIGRNLEYVGSTWKLIKSTNEIFKICKFRLHLTSQHRIEFANATFSYSINHLQAKGNCSTSHCLTASAANPIIICCYRFTAKSSNPLDECESFIKFEGGCVLEFWFYIRNVANYACSISSFN